jgi:urea carboxylase
MAIGTARYSFGADEHIFVELSEEMSLESFFKGMAITTALSKQNVPGVTEICPANASYQVKFDPDAIHPNDMLKLLQQLERDTGSVELQLDTRIVEIPVLYNDPWTHETLMRFRERHQEPSSTDIEYAARINHFPSVEAFIAAHSGSPWFVSMVGFVAGLPFLFQLVERAKQIEVPKYLRPRTDTPKLTVGHGGCFGCIYSVRGAGGYQMFGITPAPIFDPAQGLSYFKAFMCLFRPGDIIKFKAIDRDAYDKAQKEVEAGTFALRIRPVEFSMKKFLADPAGYNHQLEEVLYGN